MENFMLKPACRSRREFVGHLSAGITGGLLSSLGSASSLLGLQRNADTDSLKIVKVEPHLLTGVRGYAPWLFVRVETAEGIVGWGEGTNFPGVQPIATAIGNLRSAVVGQSAWDIEKLWNRMYRYLYYNGMGGVVMAAISAIDVALYDVVGKKLGVPVYKLLGGQVHEKLRVYANGWTDGIDRTSEALTKRTKELVAKGYTGCKFDPFSSSPYNREVTREDLRDAVAQVKAIREAGGPDYDIAIDVHGRWNTKSTIEIIRALEPYRLFFYEEAVPPENIAAMRRFDAGYAAAKQKIESGVIGKPIVMKSSSRDPFRPSLEYLDPKNSGGLFTDCGIHDIDLARWFMGEVRSVYSIGGNLAYPEMDEIGDVDNAITTLQFESGSLGVIDLSRSGVYGYDIRTEILGTQGTLQIGYLRETPLMVLTKGNVGHDTVPYFMFRCASTTSCVSPGWRDPPGNT